jgi:hypothetical protein
MAKRMLMITALFMFAAMPCAARAADALVPPVMGFHAALTDEGGNPVADGEVAAAFRIIDAAGTILYEEQQRVNSVGGQVAALIGNGLTGDGAPTGGVPIELLDPRGGRYLQVEVAGMAPLPMMELATVPYAAYAQEALGVAKEAIAFEDLSAAAVEELGKAMTDGAGAQSIVVREELAAPEAAAEIGVASGLASSTATDLQGVLDDLDGAIVASDARIAVEEGARSSADATEASARQDADGAEAAARSSADDGVDKRVQAIENPHRLSFERSAWGSVTLDGNQNPVLHGQNASIAKLNAGVYRISFSSPMSDASYAAVVTPASTVGGGGTLMPLSITNKAADGFTVGLGTMVNQSFDFIVMGM